jgi:hypothetical protein
MGEKEEFYLGIDVGTSSVRAGLVNPAGRVLHFSTEEITIRNPRHLSSQSNHPFLLSEIQILNISSSSMNMDLYVFSFIVSEKEFKTVLISVIFLTETAYVRYDRTMKTIEI